MKVRCPHCGSTADSQSSFAFSTTRHEFTFRCISLRCQKTFTGKVELSLAAPKPAPGVVLMRDQNIHLTDC